LNNFVYMGTLERKCCALGGINPSPSGLCKDFPVKKPLELRTKKACFFDTIAWVVGILQIL
ncbi:MAG: hypothetical protein ACOX9C_12105, partial [Kiritimatiellia bacterium]